MLLIRGSFRVDDGAEPDGDTLPFIPDDVADWKLVGGRAEVVPKADGRTRTGLHSLIEISEDGKVLRIPRPSDQILFLDK
ncbi:hypothetical protein [Streptomyces sp. NPDC090021]|uniref:hypothetical protein n=1 Tax=Streptomyces sp. NPDC090021 TaxID=3365919 RepID=UPI00382745FE